MLNLSADIEDLSTCNFSVVSLDFSVFLPTSSCRMTQDLLQHRPLGWNTVFLPRLILGLVGRFPLSNSAPRTESIRYPLDLHRDFGNISHFVTWLSIVRSGPQMSPLSFLCERGFLCLGALHLLRDRVFHCAIL